MYYSYVMGIDKSIIDLKKKGLIVIVLISMVWLTACDKESDMPIEKETKVSKVSEDVLHMDNLVLTVMRSYPDSKKNYVYHFLCVLRDGSIYSASYLKNKSGSDDNDFLRRLYSSEDTACDLFENVSLLGKLPKDEVEFLNDKISNIDMDSEYYWRADDVPIPDVEETISYTVYSYATNNDEEKETFRIKTWGLLKGSDYETYDKNAIAALEFVKGSEFFSLWEEACDNSEELVEENGGKTMYKYEKTDWEKLPMERSKIAGMTPYENAENHSLFIGQVITLFGQPEYWSENNEDMCSWAVAAINEAGEEIYLEIYYGASGPAIGGGSDSDSKKVAEELMELIKKAEPTDFHKESIYEDFGVKVEMGVKDGEPYYNSEMGEDMFE